MYSPMQNPFIIARFVLFALLVNLNVLVLAFATWNVNAAASIEQLIPVTTIFLMLSCCIIVFCIALGTAELVIPQANTAQVLFECVWSAVLSIFQTGTAISVTINSTTVCRETSDWALCTSSSLLVPTTWLSSIIIFIHFLSLFMSAMSHVRTSPYIWTKTVYSVDWFNLQDSCKSNPCEPGLDTWARHMKDIEARPHAKHSIKAPWARSIRRGVDAPFQRSSPTPTVTSPPAVTPLPITPLRVQSRSIAGSRFIEKFRDSAHLSRAESIDQFTKDSQRQASFPHQVENCDLPIPLPRLSEWIRADTIKGINVHSFPTSP